MASSVPGILTSRDGSVREYIGHSNQGGVLLGRSERHGRGWISVCDRCRSAFGASSQREAVISLRDHWRVGSTALNHGQATQ